MATCAFIKPDGEVCRAHPMKGEEWCSGHHPARDEERRLHGARGGKRGGRGRKSQEASRIQARFEELADMVYRKEITTSVANSMGLLLNGAIGALKASVDAKEKEEVRPQVEEIRDMLEAKGSEMEDEQYG
jgi:hypothetical protein